jgi:hypothetical protein
MHTQTHFSEPIRYTLNQHKRLATYLESGVFLGPLGKANRLEESMLGLCCKLASLFEKVQGHVKVQITAFLVQVHILNAFGIHFSRTEQGVHDRVNVLGLRVCVWKLNTQKKDDRYAKSVRYDQNSQNTRRTSHDALT